MIVIRGHRREAPLATTAFPIRCRRDPPLSVLPTNVNDEICLHLASMVAAWAVPYGCALLGMRLHCVLLEATLLNKGLTAARLLADMRHLSSMLLHVIEHGVLTLLDIATFRTDKLPLLIPQVSHLCYGGHPTV